MILLDQENSSVIVDRSTVQHVTCRSMMYMIVLVLSTKYYVYVQQARKARSDPRDEEILAPLQS